jgi:hypothetical protein
MRLLPLLASVTRLGTVLALGFALNVRCELKEGRMKEIKCERKWKENGKENI